MFLYKKTCLVSEISLLSFVLEVNVAKKVRDVYSHQFSSVQTTSVVQYDLK